MLRINNKTNNQTISTNFAEVPNFRKDEVDKGSGECELELTPNPLSYEERGLHGVNGVSY